MFVKKNMGLSSKKVSGDEFDWMKNLMQTEALELPKNTRIRQQQQQQQQLVPLKCPRCDSTNTKFCYYNNYNRSQPRHFCKSCRRHWTKGGTLRNVPVGGGRKNKRHKTGNSSSTTTTTGNNNNRHHLKNERRSTTVAIKEPQQHPPFSFGDQKNMPEILYQALNQPPTSTQTSSQPDYINSSSSNSNNFLSATLPLDSQLPLPSFPFTGLSSFDNNPLSSSFTGSHFQSSNVFNYTVETPIAGDPSTITTTNPMLTPWQISAPSSLMDSSSYWNWEDLNTLISIDITQPSDDSQNKQ